LETRVLHRSSIEERCQCSLEFRSSSDKNKYTYYRIYPSIHSLIIIIIIIVTLFLIVSLHTNTILLKFQINDHYRQMVSNASLPPTLVAFTTPYIIATYRDVLSLVSLIGNNYSNTSVTMQRSAMFHLFLVSVMVMLPSLCSSACANKRASATCKCLDACSAYAGDIYKDCAQFCSYNTEPLPRCMCEEAYKQAKNRQVRAFQVTGVRNAFVFSSVKMFVFLCRLKFLVRL
jgi:hypothetical protein